MISDEPLSSQPQTTERFIVQFRRNQVDAGISTLRDTAGLNNVASTADSTTGVLAAEELSDVNVEVLDEIDVAIISGDFDQIQLLKAASNDRNSPILTIEPEEIYYLANDNFNKINQASSSTTGTGYLEYLRGYRDAVNSLVDNLINDSSSHGQAIAAAIDESQATWGLQLTKVINSSFSGRGIKIAILDTGVDLTHPDIANRIRASESFVQLSTGAPFLPVQDLHGHGTHCVGTACGIRNPGRLPRYGIAYNAEIYVGKVMNDTVPRPSGLEGEIRKGINWAIKQGCHIISMSIEGSTTVIPRYEQTGNLALEKGTLIIAAAGNDSDRARGVFNGIGNPANSSSIMAVGAIDSQLKVANFSNRGLNQSGGKIDIAAPGVDVYSSYLASRGFPQGYIKLNGTSMATPHVAGIAALIAEATGARGSALWTRLVQTASPLSLATADVGAGLVQAP